MIQLPRQIMLPTFRLIKVDSEKRPIEPNWTSLRNYPPFNQEILDFIKNNNQYGVLCGTEIQPGQFLCVIDFDNASVQQEIMDSGILPETFTVKTARKGLFHLYYLTDNPKSWKVLDSDKNTIADIQGAGKQVIGAGTMLEDGRKYEIVKNVPIIYVPSHLIEKTLRPYDAPSTDKATKNVKKTDDPIIEDIKIKLLVPQMLQELGIDTSKNPTNCPFHASKAGKCLSYNDHIWHCFHCDESGDVITLYQKIMKKDFYTTKNDLIQKLGITVTEMQKLAFESINDFTKHGLQKFLELQPIYYDENGIFWVWDYKLNSYQRKDETDILNMVDVNVKMNGTFKGGIKNEILEGIKRKGRLKRPEDLSKNCIQFKDKIINFQTGEEFTANPQYFTINPLPYKLGDTSSTPTMDKIFADWVGAERVQTLYEIMAFCTVTDYFISRVWVFVGRGRNGKSTFLELINKFIGQENCTSSELEYFTSRFESLSLYKKLVCFLGETNFNIIKDTSIIKRLTGQDLMRYEIKGGKTFQDKNYAKIIIATNNLPQTQDKTEGFYRRFSIIDWNSKFEERKDFLSIVPDIEFENLGRKVVEILRTLSVTCKFTGDETIEERAKRYEAKSNPLRLFIDENCVVDVNSELPDWQFKQEYLAFSEARGFRKQTNQEVNVSLANEGFTREKRNVKKDNGEYTTHYFLCGVKWKPGHAGVVEKVVAVDTGNIFQEMDKKVV